MEFLAHYLKAIENISTKNKEHSSRTALENLLNALKEHLATANKDLNSLIIKHEPNNDKEGRGAPDFMILIKVWQ